MFGSKRRQTDFDAEIESHLSIEADRLKEQGYSEEEARAAARRTFGNVTLARETFYESGRWPGWDQCVGDLRIGFRRLRRSPGFLAAAILTLALGVGANTAIFSVVNAVLLSPLPYADPDRLVLVKEMFPKISAQPVSVSAPDIATIQRVNHVFERVAGFRVWTYELSGNGDPERVTGDRVGSDLFPVLGVSPLLGRFFTAAEDLLGQPVVILSYNLWQRRYGGNRDVLGQTMDLDRKAHTIIGVMPPDFVFPLPGMDQGGSADLWVPLSLTDAERAKVGDNFDNGVLARLKPGIGLNQAESDLELVARAVLNTYAQWARENHQIPGELQLRVVPEPLADQVKGPIRPILLLLFGAVGFLLLIACVNIANLLLVRTIGRQQEMAIQLAIGAGRFRLFRQLLAEGMLLATAGGASGLAVAIWIKQALVAHMPADIPQFRTVSLDLPVLLFTFGLATVTGLFFGALPALFISRTDVNSSLKHSGRSGSLGPEHQRMRAALVVLEVALSVVLLIGAGLLLRSFLRVLETNPGFRPEQVLTTSLDLPQREYLQDFPKVFAFFRQLLERLRQMPGATAVGGSTDLPLLGQWTHIFTPEGYVAPPGVGLNLCNHSVVLGDYLQAMGIPLLRGRYFGDRDRPDSLHVLIVSESLAKKFWPGQDPIGKRLKWGPPQSSNPWLTVIGVAGDVKQGPLDAATLPHTYESYEQLGAAMSLRVAVRAQRDPMNLVADLRSTVRSLDPRLALGRIRTMEQIISRSTETRRFNLWLLGSFAAVALLLAAIGIYGMLAYSVSCRTHEIGIRMALGACARDVVQMVLRLALPVTALGMALGLAGAFSLTRLMRGLLYEVSPGNPATVAGVLLLLGCVAVAAAWLPARRATRIDPASALRQD